MVHTSAIHLDALTIITQIHDRELKLNYKMLLIVVRYFIFGYIFSCYVYN